MSTTPFLGCKISLISKSEIRYEGILYTIDSKESTITLAKVKSYGTETRQAERQVPPRDEEFEYIIFRANDIKDLIVDDPPNTIAPGLADPAIIQAHSTSTTQASSASTSFPSGSIGAAMNSASSNLSSGVANQARPFQSGLSSTVQGNSNQSVFSAPTHVGGVPVSYTGAKAGSIGSGSRNSSPLGRTRGRKASGSRSRRNSGSKSGRSTPKDAFSQFREPQSQQNKREGGGQLNRRDGQQQDQHQRGNRTRGAQSAGGQQRQPRGGQTGQQNYQQQNYQQRNQAWGQQSGYNNRGFGRQDGQHGGRQGGQYGRSGDYQDRNRQYGQNDRWGQSGQQQGYQRRGPPPFRQNPNAHQPRTNSTSQAGAPKPKETLKFEGEFDFEKSNLEFSELVKNVGDLKIGEDGKAEGETANGEATSTQPKDDHQAGFTGSEAGDKEEDIFYDKTKSFFDSISCEASEREKGTGQRVDWKKERKTNSETFGQMPFNSWRRPGYRPRGGGYGYGYGYGNRGRFQSRGGGYGQGFRPSGGSRDGGHGSGERRSFSNNGPKPQMAK